MKDLYNLLFFIRQKNLITNKILNEMKLSSSNFFKQLDGVLNISEIQRLKSRILLKVLKEEYTCCHMKLQKD